MTHKEFYHWLEGYLQGKENMSYDQIALFIVEVKNKMKEVNEVNTFFQNPRTVIPYNPLKEDRGDDLGKPPKIVM